MDLSGGVELERTSLNEYFSIYYHQTLIFDLKNTDFRPTEGMKWQTLLKLN